MKKSTVTVLQSAIVLIGVGALAFLLWEPRVEGRNAHTTLFETYFADPFLAYAYVASIPFFMGLYQACKALGLAGQGKAFSQASAKALRTIRHCALAVIAFVAGGEIIIMQDTSDDRAGGVAMGVLVALGSIAVAAVAARLERRIR